MNIETLLNDNYSAGTGLDGSPLIQPNDHAMLQVEKAVVALMEGLLTRRSSQINTADRFSIMQFFFKNVAIEWTEHLESHSTYVKWNEFLRKIFIFLRFSTPAQKKAFLRMADQLYAKYNIEKESSILNNILQ